MTRQKNRIKSQLRYLGVEIPVEYLEPHSNWSKRFLNWLKQVGMRTPSGRQTLDILIMQFEALRKQKAEMTRKLRALSHTERFEETLEAPDDGSRHRTDHRPCADGRDRGHHAL